MSWGLAGCGWIARDHVAPVVAEVGALLDPDADARERMPGAAVSSRGRR